MVGYTAGGVLNQDGKNYDMKGSPENYTFAIEAAWEGRNGFFYSNQSSRALRKRLT